MGSLESSGSAGTDCGSQRFNFANASAIALGYCGSRGTSRFGSAGRRSRAPRGLPEAGALERGDVAGAFERCDEAEAFERAAAGASLMRMVNAMR
jgi:hypothetical protein